VFAAERWADAFIAVCVDSRGAVPALNDTEYAAACEGLEVLRAVVAAWGGRLRQWRGQRDAGLVRNALERALQKGGVPAESRPVKAAVAVLSLLVQKNHGAEALRVSLAVEQRAKALAGVQDVTLETPAAPDERFLAEFTAAIARTTGAKKVLLEKKTRPELLGGFCVRIGCRRLDYSVAGEIRRMKKAFGAL
jgi:F0F1-type ATP synthase delta subunit